MFWRWDGVTAAAQNSAEGDNALNVPTGSDVFQVPAHSLLPKTPMCLHPACRVESLGHPEHASQPGQGLASSHSASLYPVTAHFCNAWLLYVVFDCWHVPTCRVSSSPSHSAWLRTDQQWPGARRQAQELFLQHLFPLQTPAAQALMLSRPLIPLPAAPVRFLSLPALSRLSQCAHLMPCTPSKAPDSATCCSEVKLFARLHIPLACAMLQLCKCLSATKHGNVLS